jgi:hypothetical protein
MMMMVEQSARPPSSASMNVLGFFPLAPWSYIELDALALVQRLEAFPLDGGEVHEHVVAAIA